MFGMLVHWELLSDTELKKNAAHTILHRSLYVENYFTRGIESNVRTDIY